MGVFVRVALLVSLTMDARVRMEHLIRFPVPTPKKKEPNYSISITVIL